MGAANPLVALDTARRHVSEHGLLSLVASGVGDALPEPHSTRFGGHCTVIDEVLLDDTTLSITDRVRACRHGLTDTLYTLYGLENGGDPALYLDEVSRRRARYINDSPEELDDKERFHRHLEKQGFGDYLPTLYGVVEDGRFEGPAHASVRDVVDEHGRAVLKRHRGAAGHYVYVCTGDEDGEGVTLHGSGGGIYSLDRVVDNDERYLVTEFCEQAEYARHIYPHAANTIRILTLGNDDASVAAAVHRFGSNRTGVLDNFSQGGLSALVDLETGELSVAAEPLDDGEIAWHEAHPDTDVPIAGVTVPGWPRIRDRISTIATETTGMAHVGWDIVVTGPRGFKIIEGNSFPDPDVIQVHRPLLADSDVRRFYSDHGVL